jgi:hypothetical protein
MDFTDQFVFDDSSIGLTGVDTLSPDYEGDSALLGSGLQLDYGESGYTDYGVGDLGDPSLDASIFDDWSLGGASDPAPSGNFWDDLGISDNGMGSAAASDGSRPAPGFQVASLIGGFEKFGSNIAALLLNSNNASHVAAAPGGTLAAANPNNSVGYGITGSHAVLIVAVAGILIFAVMAGGSK